MVPEGPAGPAAGEREALAAAGSVAKQREGQRLLSPRAQPGASAAFIALSRLPPFHLS